jgi:hypothetical protein
MAPLQRLAVKPIEDPTEQAALNDRLKRSEEAIADGPGTGSSSPAAMGEAVDNPS